MTEKSFATSVSCIDGRVQLPMISWIKDRYSVDFVDTITAPGIDKVIFDGNIESIKKGELWKTNESEKRKNFLSMFFTKGEKIDLIKIIEDILN